MIIFLIVELELVILVPSSINTYNRILELLCKTRAVVLNHCGVTDAWRI